LDVDRLLINLKHWGVQEGIPDHPPWEAPQISSCSEHHDDERDEVPPARPSRGFGLRLCSFPVWSIATTEQQVRFGGSE